MPNFSRKFRKIANFNRNLKKNPDLVEIFEIVLFFRQIFEKFLILFEICEKIMILIEIFEKCLALKY